MSVEENNESLDVSFSKDFMWNRQFDFKWDLTKALRFSLQTATNAIIEEPYYTPEFGKDIMNNGAIQFGQT